jgi:hypothetical protein
MYGSHIRRLDMPVCHGSYIREIPMMHERDCRVGLGANIPPFGACFSPNNRGPEILVHDADGMMPWTDENGNSFMPNMPIQGRPCTPSFGLRWNDAFDETLVDGRPALRTNCTITCHLMGTVVFLDDGQGV